MIKEGSQQREQWCRISFINGINRSQQNKVGRSIGEWVRVLEMNVKRTSQLWRRGNNLKGCEL